MNFFYPDKYFNGGHFEFYEEQNSFELLLKKVQDFYLDEEIQKFCSRSPVACLKNKVVTLLHQIFRPRYYSYKNHTDISRH